MAVVSLVALLLLGGAPGPAAAAPPAGFVTANGTQLELDGRPWQLFGASTYGTSSPGGSQSIGSEIGLAVGARLNTLRIVDMFDTRGVDPAAPTQEADWARIDQLLAAIHDAGLHTILDLSAFRNHLQNRELYQEGAAALAASYPVPTECTGRTGDDLDRCVGARWCIENAAECTNPYSTAQAPAWDSFLGFVATRVNTVTGVEYRDDPTIALVAFAGEPNPPNSGEPLKPATQELTNFYARVFDQWKARDPNHLVTTGGLLHIDWEELYGGSSGIDHAAIFALPNQDVLSIHDYFGRFPATAANDTKVEVVAPAAASVGKPWITEEFGFPQEPVDGSTTYTEADRGAWYRTVFDLQRNPPVGVPSAGVAFWNLGPEVRADSHDVNTGTPATWAAVTSYAWLAAPGSDSWAPVGWLGEGLVSALGVDDAPNGDLWVVEGNADRIHRLGTDGSDQGTVGSFGTGDTEFNLPSALAVGPDGTLYVGDIGNARIKHFADDGTYLGSFGASGQGPGQLDNPRGIAIADDGTVYVADVGNGYIHKWSSTGTFLGTLGSKNQYGAPFGIGIDPDGNIWVTDHNGYARKVAPDGSVLLTLSGFGQPSDVDFDRAGRAHIANFNTGEVRVYDSSGAFVETLDLVRPINSLEIGDDGNLYVGSDDRVLVLAPRGGAPDPDVDDDGVANEIDTGDGSFADDTGTSGQVLQPVPAGLAVLVEDITPDGVRIGVSGTGSDKASFTVCGYPGTLRLAAGSVVELTCGSVLLHVVQGSAEFELSGQPTTVTVDQGATAKLDVTGSGTPTVQNQGGGTVTTTTAGATTTVPAGTTSTALTSSGLCALTDQSVTSSPKWQNSRPAPRAVARAVVAAACGSLERITPTTRPQVKKVLVVAYKASVDVLRLGGWLTADQARTFKALAETL